MLFKCLLKSVPQKVYCSIPAHMKVIFWFIDSNTFTVTATCTNKTAKVGGNASIECYMDEGAGYSGHHLYESFLRKVSSFL